MIKPPRFIFPNFKLWDFSLAARSKAVASLPCVELKTIYSLLPFATTNSLSLCAVWYILRPLAVTNGEGGGGLFRDAVIDLFFLSVNRDVRMLKNCSGNRDWSALRETWTVKILDLT